MTGENLVSTKLSPHDWAGYVDIAAASTRVAIALAHLVSAHTPNVH